MVNPASKHGSGVRLVIKVKPNPRLEWRKGQRYGWGYQIRNPAGKGGSIVNVCKDKGY
jgi:hypothetical protein